MPRSTVTDGGVGDTDGLANGTLVAQWQVPSDGSATGAMLKLTATSGGQSAIATFSDAPNKIVLENQKTGTPESTWAIHGSIDNQGDSQIEGFATQISTNAGQTVNFKIDTSFERLYARYLSARLLRRQRRASHHELCTTLERPISRTPSSTTRPTRSMPATGRSRIHGRSLPMPCRVSTSPS